MAKNGPWKTPTYPGNVSENCLACGSKFWVTQGFAIIEKTLNFPAFYTLSASNYCIIPLFQNSQVWALITSMNQAWIYHGYCSCPQQIQKYYCIACFNVKDNWFLQSRFYFFNLKTKLWPRLTVLLLKWKTTLSKKNMQYKLLDYIMERNSSLEKCIGLSYLLLFNCGHELQQPSCHTSVKEKCPADLGSVLSTQLPFSVFQNLEPIHFSGFAVNLDSSRKHSQIMPEHARLSHLFFFSEQEKSLIVLAIVELPHMHPWNCLPFRLWLV